MDNFHLLAELGNGVLIRAGLVFAAGLIVGWNFLPQPKFVKNIVSNIVGRFKTKEG